MATSKIRIAFIDYCKEKSVVSLNIPILSAGNIVTSLAEGVFETVGGLAKLMGDLSLCNLLSSAIITDTDSAAETPASSTSALRELGIRVTYQDNTTMKKYSFVIPGPNMTGLLLANTDDVDPANAAWAAFVTKFESTVVSELGNSVTVLGGHLVGRNN